MLSDNLFDCLSLDKFHAIRDFPATINVVPDIARGMSAWLVIEAKPADVSHFVHSDKVQHSPPSAPARGYATFCILFAKSRPEVAGGRGLPSLW